MAWSLDEIVAETTAGWAERGLGPELVAFGSDGAGNWFGMRAEADTTAVYHWDSIDAAARVIADDLLAFWPAWLCGQLTV